MKKGNNGKKGISTEAIVGISAGVVALAATSYYFFGPEGKKNRDKLKGWMIKMKGEIVDKLEDAKEVTESVYNQIVDSVAANYMKGGKVAEADVRAFVANLKRQWAGISRVSKAKKTTVGRQAGTAKARAKKARVDVSKKSSKKTSKKK